MGTADPRYVVWMSALIRMGIAIVATVLALSALSACSAKDRESGCTKDTDCKGDRVCENGRCTDVTAPLASAAPSADRVRTMFARSTTDIAKAAVMKLAYEAYPQWSSANPAKGCPERLEDLREFSDGDTKDPWGRPYKMFCGAALPPGAKGLAVMSTGPDETDGTSDDIKSWD